MTKQRKRRKPDRDIVWAVRPTDERQALNGFAHAGAAWRVKPIIDTLRDAGKLTVAEHARLNHYRDQASRAEDDVAQASTLAPERMMGGGGTQCTTGRIPASLIASPAIIETGRIERDLGSLQAFVRAVVVDDVSLTQWCVRQHGGHERYDDRGNYVAMIPNRQNAVMALALFDLKYAAGMIVK